MSTSLSYQLALWGTQSTSLPTSMIDCEKKSMSCSTKSYIKCKRNDYYDSFVDLVHSHGGVPLFPPQCISSKKMRLCVKCSKGHEFLITLTTLLKGRFCLQCHKVEKDMHRKYVYHLRQQRELHELHKQEQELRDAKMRYIKEVQALQDPYSSCTESTDYSCELTDNSACTINDCDSVCTIKDSTDSLVCFEIEIVYDSGISNTFR